MLEFIHRHLNHVLAFLLLLSRLGDIGTTYLLTPTLQLEANPVIRRLGWRFAIATLPFCLLPYLSLPLGLMALFPFLLVSAANASQIWIARTLGEQEYKALLLRAARQSRPSRAVGSLVVAAAFVLIAGLVVLMFYPDPGDDWGFWIGCGICLYAVVRLVHGTLALRRLFREADSVGPERSAA